MKKILLLTGIFVGIYYWNKNKKATNGTGTTPAPAGNGAGINIPDGFYWNSLGNSLVILRNTVYYDSDVATAQELIKAGLVAKNITIDDATNAYLFKDNFGGEAKNIMKNQRPDVKFQPLNDEEAKLYISQNPDLQTAYNSNDWKQDLQKAKQHWIWAYYNETRPAPYLRTF